MTNSERLLEKARNAQRSSKYVALADAVDPRDVVALANVGGGVVVTAAPPDVEALAEELGFADLQLVRIERGTVLVVGPAGEAPLTAEDGPYFRHGGKSVPATREDLRRFVNRRVTQVKRKLLGDIKRVLTAPEGSEVVAIEWSEDDAGERLIRITTDEHAPVYRAVDFDVTHPYRQKEVIAEVNRRLPDGRAINAYELQAIRRTKEIDPDFVHRPRFGTNQYSESFVDWLVGQIEGDPDFVATARTRYYELRRVSDSRSRG